MMKTKKFCRLSYVFFWICVLTILIGFALVLLNSTGVLMAFRPLNLGNPKPIIRNLEPFRMILRLRSF